MGSESVLHRHNPVNFRDDSSAHQVDPLLLVLLSWHRQVQQMP